jgi:hypothetical protein
MGHLSPLFIGIILGMTADTQYYHVDIDKVISLINSISVREL